MAVHELSRESLCSTAVRFRNRSASAAAASASRRVNSHLPDPSSSAAGVLEGRTASLSCRSSAVFCEIAPSQVADVSETCGQCPGPLNAAGPHRDAGSSVEAPLEYRTRGGRVTSWPLRVPHPSRGRTSATAVRSCSPPANRVRGSWVAMAAARVNQPRSRAVSRSISPHPCAPSAGAARRPDRAAVPATPARFCWCARMTSGGLLIREAGPAISAACCWSRLGRRGRGQPLFEHSTRSVSQRASIFPGLGARPPAAATGRHAAWRPVRPELRASLRSTGVRIAAASTAPSRAPPRAGRLFGRVICLHGAGRRGEAPFELSNRSCRVVQIRWCERIMFRLRSRGRCACFAIPGFQQLRRGDRSVRPWLWQRRGSP